MYRIINNDTGETVGYFQRPHYIRLSGAGCFVTTDEDHAQGVAYRSTPYNLRGRESMGVTATVYLIEEDGGVLLDDLRAAASALPELEDALCEQDIAIEERFAAIEDALCELDGGEME